MNIISVAATLLASILLIGCNPIKSTAEAEKAAVEFHGLFDSQDYEKIYDTSHPDLKAAQSKQELVAFIKAVREKLGTVKSSDRKGWKANSYNLKTTVVLSYATVFEHGQGTETFTYRIEDGKASLLGWHINSNALMSNPAPLTAEADKPQ
ncbi:uncharacterized protein DUF3887 [Prosthecobacter fusiformis]|uniref:Uncharacterized protein DUF3887 n=1 Tax=Prosthecobacter fusiformis TaxID=48464 RepID=A0A4R7S3T8_9BACT|nr:DUF4019 domain-containing protein [Prosthecobacter fusiformis]TDU72954.1 uncharacterized protein DUF3887 [Prosthecobacter fusiformis]